MRELAMPLAVLVLLSACQQDEAKPAAPVAAAPVGPQKQALARAPAVSLREVKEANDLYVFEYAYPAAAAAIAELKAWFDTDIVTHRSELVANARIQRAQSQQAGYSYNALGAWINWDIVTDIPGWLSLSARVSTYEGGAHPNHRMQSFVWDKQAKLRRDPVEMFSSKQAISGAIRRDFCRALDHQRAERRGEQVNPKSGSPFDECIDPLASTVILGSSSGKSFDRIGVLVAPYEAGPYAEGDYEVTLPVTDAILQTVKPEYRDSFAVKR